MTTNFTFGQQDVAVMAGSRSDPQMLAERAALRLYHRTRRKGWLRRMWAKLSGHSLRPLDLSDVAAVSKIQGSHNLGIQAVPIAAIRGSEGRCDDFDASWSPLHEHDRSRWMSVATAWQLAVPLPPIDLIQVGEIYFVRDGHHRISVALAHGQRFVEASVTAWQVNGPHPLPLPSQGRGPGG